MIKTKTILLFEPWHFGDLIIAADIARDLKTNGFKIGMMYNPKWEDWIIDNTFIDYFLPLKIPWTARNFSEKYALKNYSLSFWKKVFLLKKNIHPDIIVDVRGDIRHKLFLKIFFPSSKLISLSHEKKINVYQKKNVLSQKLHLTNNNDLPQSVNDKYNSRKTVILFCSAMDKNREVPEIKIHEILYSLSSLNIKLQLILTPNEEKQKWVTFFSELQNPYFNFIKGGLLDISNKIKESDVVISTDSGWLHLAQFYNKKCIGLFAFDTVSSWAPPAAIIIKPSSCLHPSMKYKNKYQDVQPLKDLDVSQLQEALFETVTSN